jgi:dihydroorotate dehydrogenase (NAD+) catalytic subunit
MGIIDPDLSVRLGNLALKNPVILASGTSGYGEECTRFIDLNRLGGIVVKGTSLMPRLGNPPQRIAETAAGIISSIGLQNVGVDRFISDKLPFLRRFDVRTIVNIVGSSIDEYAEVARRLDEAEGISALEVNISCPNVKEGGISFGRDPRETYHVVKSVRASTRLPLIVKLSPDVTDISLIARAAADGGSDILSLINNIPSMIVDVKTRRPVLGNVTGGLSGPAIKPIALRMVWQVHQAAIGLPIIGIGGISNFADAVEFILAGASAIQVGTANLVDPEVSLKIIAGLKAYCVENKVDKISELVGALVC